MVLICRKNVHLVTLLCFSMFFIAIVAKGQQTEGNKLFKTIERPTNIQKDTFVNHAGFLSLNNKQLRKLWSERPVTLQIAIPRSAGDDIIVELEQNQILASDFEVRTSSNKEVDYNRGIYYNGSLKGNSNSHATLSVFQDQVMGVLATDTGNLVLGALSDKKGNPKTEYILYNDQDMEPIPDFSCKTVDNFSKPSQQHSTPDQAGGKPDHSNKCISIYFECDYEMYKDKGNSVNNTVNFTTGVFNEVAKLYDVAGINVNISEVFVWDSSSPYSDDTSSSTYLEGFKDYRSNQGGFKGDLGHLLSTTSANLGGRAYIDVLCGSFGFAYGFSNIYNDFETYPTYSWSVYIISHELGHNIGSRHTQRCNYWTTPKQQAIDSCGSLENGDCNTLKGIPSGGGTIMSYCHTSSAGIDFTKGFGTYPRDTLQHFVNKASCINACICRDTLSPKTCKQYTLPSGNDTLTSSGIYYDTISKQGGCDSIFKVNLIIQDTLRISDTITACDTYTWPVNGKTYTNSGAYFDTFSNQQSCDTIHRLNLTIHPSENKNVQYQACDSFTVPSKDETYTQSGTYRDTINTVKGCDSILTIDLTVIKIDTGLVRIGPAIKSQTTNGSYQWLNCAKGYQSIRNATSRTFAPDSNGTYAVEVTKSGCKDTSECFSLNNIGVVVNDFGQSFQVYPNPTNANVTVNLGKTYKGASVTVKNASGKTINRKEISNSRIFDLNLSGKKGLYVITIKTANNKRARVKVLKTQ